MVRICTTIECVLRDQIQAVKGTVADGCLGESAVYQDKACIAEG